MPGVQKEILPYSANPKYTQGRGLGTSPDPSGCGCPADLPNSQPPPVSPSADSAEDFARRLEHPRAFAHAIGAGLGEYLARALRPEETLCFAEVARRIAAIVASINHLGSGPINGLLPKAGICFNRARYGRLYG